MINNDRYWQRDRESAVEIIWQHASHPSCVGWDITNECYLYACYAVGGEGQSKYGERLASTSEEIRKRIWPGFWVLSDGNGNLGGRLNFTSWHYMNQGWSGGYGDGDRTLSRRQARNGLQVAFYSPPTPISLIRPPKSRHRIPSSATRTPPTTGIPDGLRLDRRFLVHRPEQRSGHCQIPRRQSGAFNESAIQYWPRYVVG